MTRDRVPKRTTSREGMWDHVSDPDLDFAQIWQDTIATLDADGCLPASGPSSAWPGSSACSTAPRWSRCPNDYTKDVVETRVREQVTQALSAQLGIARPAGRDGGPLAGARAARLDEATRGRDADRARGRRPPSTSRWPRRPAGQRRPPLMAPSDSHRRPRERDRHRVSEESATGSTRSTPSTPSSSARATGSPTRPRVAVAEAPAKAYNPLFVYGESGLGKTHLLHAIGHYARNLYPHVQGALRELRGVHQRLHQQHPRRQGLRTSSAATATSTCCSSTTSSSSQGKVQTQEEFFHTFNTLHNANKQVVITSDLPPKQLSAASRSACAAGSSGACSPTSSRPTSRPASRSCARRPSRSG